MRAEIEWLRAKPTQHIYTLTQGRCAIIIIAESRVGASIRSVLPHGTQGWGFRQTTGQTRFRATTLKKRNYQTVNQLTGEASRELVFETEEDSAEVFLRSLASAARWQSCCSRVDSKLLSSSVSVCLDMLTGRLCSAAVTLAGRASHCKAACLQQTQTHITI